MTTSPRSGTATKKGSKWERLAICSPVLVVLDQWTKFLAVDHLTSVFARTADLSFDDKLDGFYAYRHLERFARQPYEVWNGFWRMAYAENPGSAFGLFSTLPPHLRFGFFTAVTLVAIALILAAYRRVHDDQRLRQLAFALVLGGALGNFADRLARRYVIDFIDWGWRHVRWPTFNLADVFVVIGVGLILVTDRPHVRVVASEPAAGS